MRESVRVQAGRETEPSAVIIDSRSVKAAETKGDRGHDANKKVTGRNRHLLVDVMGLLLAVVVHAADIQARAGAILLLQGTFANGFARLQLIWAEIGRRDPGGGQAIGQRQGIYGLAPALGRRTDV